jgi:hypothetical protein
MNWMKSQRWEIASNNLVMQNPLVVPTSNFPDIPPITVEASKKTICFFGRLEPRKGVKNFLIAIKPYLTHANFILVGGESPGNDPFDGFETDSPVRSVKVVTDLNSIQAQTLFSKLKALVVVPSLSENCPYTIIETATFSNKIIASKVGGIPELLPTESLFESVEELGELIRKYIFENNEIGSNPLMVSNEVALNNYNKLFSNKKLSSRRNTLSEVQFLDKIGVVVAHYNQSAFLGKALLSVQKQSYSNFVCVVIDDGSCEVERENFKLISESFKNDSRFIFIFQDNCDVGATRNKGTEFIEFLFAWSALNGIDLT